MLPIAGSRTVALHGVTPVPCASIQGRAIAVSTATQAAATIAPSPRCAASLATRTRQRAGVARNVGTAVPWRNSPAAPTVPRAMKRNRKSRPALKTWRTPAAVSRPAGGSLGGRVGFGGGEGGVAAGETEGPRGGARLGGFV